MVCMMPTIAPGFLHLLGRWSTSILHPGPIVFWGRPLAHTEVTYRFLMLTSNLWPPGLNFPTVNHKDASITVLCCNFITFSFICFVCTRVCLWRSGNNFWELFLSSHRVGQGWMRVIRLGDECFYLLSHLTYSCVVIVLKLFFYYVYGGFAHVYLCALCICRAYRGQKWLQDSLEQPGTAAFPAFLCCDFKGLYSWY